MDRKEASPPTSLRSGGQIGGQWPTLAWVEVDGQIQCNRAASYSLCCDLLSIATMPSTSKPAAQIASITSEVEIKSWATW